MGREGKECSGLDCTDACDSGRPVAFIVLVIDRTHIPIVDIQRNVFHGVCVSGKRSYIFDKGPALREPAAAIDICLYPWWRVEDDQIANTKGSGRGHPVKAKGNARAEIQVVMLLELAHREGQEQQYHPCGHGEKNAALSFRYQACHIIPLQR